MTPKTKPDFYERWKSLEFGNRVRMWNSLRELLADDYRGAVKKVEQVVYIPPNGPAVHAESAGEFGHRPDAARLQQLQQRQDAGSGPGHGHKYRTNTGRIVSGIRSSVGCRTFPLTRRSPWISSRSASSPEPTGQGCA